MRLEKIKLKGLKNFVNSDRYQQFKTKPISLPRALSYIQNPRAKEKDIVLYMLFENENIIAYRTILPDTLYINSQSFHFGWLSGNYVKSAYRRQGLSSKLLVEVEKDWGNRLMFTNYAPESKLVYDKSGNFQFFRSYEVMKFYTAFNLAGILPLKAAFLRHFTFILKFMDFCANFIYTVFNSRLKKDQSNDIKEISFENFTKRSGLIMRGLEEFQWILNNPWIKSDEEAKKMQKQYNFSVYAKQFENKLLAIKEINVFWILIRDGRLLIPYKTFSDKTTVGQFVNLLYATIREYKINQFEVFNTEISNEITQNHSFYIKKKKSLRNYFIHKEFLKEFEDDASLHFETGDGDLVFTT